MQSQAHRHISLFRIIVLAGVAALLITPAALPAFAQDSVPATALEATRMPKYAPRVGHPAQRPASRPNPTLARQASRRAPGQNQFLYDNGPINGTTDAWTINFGFVASDTFTVSDSNGSPITGMSFGAWLEPGDTLNSVEVSITSSEFGGITFFDSTINFSQSGCTSNQYGFDVCLETSTSFNGPSLNNGTYWVNLQNATTAFGDPVYWDENSGIGCDSQGCPSEASENSIGTIPSEAFTILGNGSTCTTPKEEMPANPAKAVTVPRSPTQSYRVIYNFTGAGDGGAPTTGLVIDAVGNLYGTTSSGGPFGAGTVFKLASTAFGWLFNRLYSFSGANGSSPDSTPVLGANGAVYGTTNGGGLGDGVLYGLSPAAHIPPSVFTDWMETLLYSFTGGNDGAQPGGSLVIDSSGNIYGNAAAGGANHNGTLYEFTSGGIQVLHAFPAFSGDGATPIGVVNSSGGLYGITSAGGAQRAGTLYTTAGGYQVLHSFMGADPEGTPTSLAADQAGNLYGATIYSYVICTAPGPPTTVYGTSVFQSSPPGWNPLILNNIDFSFVSLTSWVSTDTGGNVYGTTNNDGNQGLGEVFNLTCCWNYSDLHDFAGPPNDGATPMAAPVVDAQGNIYGTTSTGGAHGQGVVWEISP